jgi:hypothetical protein
MFIVFIYSDSLEIRRLILNKFKSRSSIVGHVAPRFVQTISFSCIALWLCFCPAFTWLQLAMSEVGFEVCDLFAFLSAFFLVNFVVLRTVSKLLTFTNQVVHVFHIRLDQLMNRLSSGPYWLLRTFELHTKVFPDTRRSTLTYFQLHMSCN